MHDYSKYAAIKASLLAEGVDITEQFRAEYGAPYLLKRRAYGNSDDRSFLAAEMPQELFLGEEPVVCGIHGRHSSSWYLDTNDGRFVLRHRNGLVVDVDFPRIPNFYSAPLPSGRRGNQVGTLYGGHSLGIFVYGHCILVDRGEGCKYCSIGPNRSQQTEFADVVRTEDVYALVRAAIELDSDVLTQVMINGGNFKDRDKGFQYYVKICAAARRAIDDCRAGKRVELHLIVFPPKDLRLLKELANLDVSVAMNTEVFSPALFAKYCPGKVREGGQATLFTALEKAVHYMGAGKVFSIFVGGLEPLDSLSQGLRHSFSLGAIPVINVFHADPGTPLSDHPLPDRDEIIAQGVSLQNIYQEYNFSRPFYEHCARNALDAEAHRALFSESERA